MPRSGRVRESGPNTDAQAGPSKRRKQSAVEAVGDKPSERNKTTNKAKKTEAGEIKAENALAWLNDEAKVRSWMSQYDLPKLLDEGEGLAYIEDFLPPVVATTVKEAIEALPEDSYDAASSSKYD
eukprot:CAMPEP_0118949090 /NCGR_PEP_ID=MMETSP1169-20130426/49003_1 /TAXON_ID=36882 /ORGANISM="Pyramimonas obovata, Strain CCMP722" /LENGTH=124 /DNA_ID=CAMNT_0006895647 /DNA_START=217 /DNA_END=588 /DNA_ORIENTATION=+